MLVLYQAEWCPYSHRVRMRLTELQLEWVARPVPVDGGERDAMEAATSAGDRACVMDGRPTIRTARLVRTRAAGTGEAARRPRNRARVAPSRGESLEDALAASGQ